MSYPRFYTGVKIYWDNHFIGLDEGISKVESKDPSLITYQNGMAAFKFIDYVEYEEFGKTKKKVLSEDNEMYFFGEFTPLEELKAMNANNEWDNAIYNIEGSNGRGMLTTPNGFHMIMPQNGIIANQFSQTKNL